jgi:hypothetical protein
VSAPFYERDGVTLYHGDCRDVLPTLGAVDHVITDPPYARDVYVRLGMPNTKNGSGTPSRLLRESFRLKNGARLGQLAAGAIGAVDELIVPCSGVFAALARRWCLVFSDVEICHVWRLALEAAGLRYVRTGAWVKPNAMPQMSGDRPAVGFDSATICHAQGPMRWNGGGHSALWTYNTAKGHNRPGHPCPKPLPLMREIVSLFTDPNDLILDPFAGSGTTLVAAKTLGRRAIGIEIEERWCEVAAKRLDSTPLPLFVVPPEPATQPEMAL